MRTLALAAGLLAAAVAIALPAGASATCVNGSPTTGGGCNCNYGWRGANCDSSCSTYCNSRGTCSTANRDVCTCWNPAAWAGDRCERAPDCTDGTKDGDEGDVDCGGSNCGFKCTSGRSCASGTDCASGVCSGNVCTDEHAACGASAVALTAHQLRAAMGFNVSGAACGSSAEATACDSWVAHVNTALAEFDMDCPVRAGALLGQVRHETNGLKKALVRAADSAAGALPLLPATWRQACNDSAVAGLKAEFASTFSACPTAGSDPCACGSNADGAAVVAQPQFAFRVAAWYFTKGANRQVDASVCGDLRFDADQGIGTTKSWVNAGAPGTGFFRISTCIKGLSSDFWRTQRTQYMIDAVRTMDAGFPATCSDAAKSGDEGDVDCGGWCQDRCEAGKTCNADVDCESHLTCKSGVCFDDHAACEAVKLDGSSFTAADLQAAMGGKCHNCASLYPHLLTALTDARMMCPLRLAAFIAQVRHESDHFRSFLRTSDAGAGALHLVPASYRAACNALPDLKAAFSSHFSGRADCDPTNNPCACGRDEEAAFIITRPEFAFATAAWYFMEGANARIPDASACTDLRMAADEGPGTWEGWVSPLYPGTGFQRVTTCMHGFVYDAGDKQRLAYYYQARRHFDAGFKGPCEDGVLGAGEADVDCGTRCYARCPDKSTCFSSDDCLSFQCDADPAGGPKGTCKNRDAGCGPGDVAAPLDTWTDADFAAMMGNDCGASGTACTDYFAPFAAAAEAHSLLCPARLPAFVSAVRYGSNGLRDLSKGGGIALPDITPAGSAVAIKGWRLACQQIPALAADFAAAFPTCAQEAAWDGKADACGCGTDAEGAAIVAKPEHAFNVAGWWFNSGAGQAYGSPTCDLLGRAVEAGGLGKPGEPPSVSSPGSGFYLTAACMTGFLGAAAGDGADLGVRASHYATARQFFEPAFALPANNCNDYSANGAETGVDCGGPDCARRCELGAACLVDGDCGSGLECASGSNTCVAAASACSNGNAWSGATGTASEIAALMGLDGAAATACVSGACGTYAADINAAMTAFDLTCQLRASAFLAAVGAATSDLSKLRDLDPFTYHDRAGALLGPVDDARGACLSGDVPGLQAAFETAFGAGCAGAGASTSCACGSMSAVAAIAADKQFAFHIAAWWFSGGASQRLGSNGCGDLRVDADVSAPSPGVGFSASPHHSALHLAAAGQDPLLAAAPGNGFFKIVACATGFRVPVSSIMAGRLSRYEKARRVFDGGFSLAGSCANGVTDGDETSPDCGGSCWARCRAGDSCSVDADCTSRNCRGGKCSDNTLDCELAAGASELTLQQLTTTMGGTCANCAAHLAAAKTAIAEAKIRCPMRLAGVLALVRHETAALTVMRSSVDNGAGAIHMLPNNFRVACQQISGMRAAFAAEFPSCSFSEKCLCGSDLDAAAVVERPEWAWKTATWWLTDGSAQVMGRPCGDLRIDFDFGWGSKPLSGSYPTRLDPGTGSQLASACTVGFRADPGADQRRSYFVHAMQVFDPTFDPSDGCFKMCPIGTFEEAACGDNGAGSNRVCKRCGINGATNNCTCPAGFEGSTCAINKDDCAGSPCQNGGTCVDGIEAYTCVCPATHTGAHCETDVSTCATCTTSACPSGTYESSPCTCASDRVCSTCTSCAAGEFEARACGADGDTVCRVVSQCGQGQYERVAPTSSSDRECVACTTCALGSELVSSPCKPTADRVCTSCSSCPDADYRVIWQCTATADTECQCLDTPARNCVLDCDPNPCANNATCHDGINNYTCTCPDMWSGPNCDIKLPPPTLSGFSSAKAIYHGTDTVQLTFTWVPAVTVTNATVFGRVSGVTATASGDTVSVSYAIQAGDASGTIPFELEVFGHGQTTIIDHTSASVLGLGTPPVLDANAPKLTAFVSAQEWHKAGSVASFELTFDHVNVSVSAATIDGQTAAAAGDNGNKVTLTYVFTTTDAESMDVPWTITVGDDAGNVASFSEADAAALGALPTPKFDRTAPQLLGGAAASAFAVVDPAGGDSTTVYIAGETCGFTVAFQENLTAFTATFYDNKPAASAAVLATTPGDSTVGELEYVFQDADPSGTVVFAVNATDLAGNVAMLSSAADFAGVVPSFDSDVPALVSFASDKQFYTGGDTITITLGFDHTGMSVDAAGASVMGNAPDAAPAFNAAGDTLTIAYTFTGSEGDGNVTFSVEVQDSNGNQVTITHATAMALPGVVLPALDTSVPTIDVSSDPGAFTLSAAEVGPGGTLTLTFKFQELISSAESNSATIGGQQAEVALGGFSPAGGSSRRLAAAPSNVVEMRRTFGASDAGGPDGTAVALDFSLTVYDMAGNKIVLTPASTGIATNALPKYDPALLAPTGACSKEVWSTGENLVLVFTFKESVTVSAATVAGNNAAVTFNGGGSSGSEVTLTYTLLATDASGTVHWSFTASDGVNTETFDHSNVAIQPKAPVHDHDQCNVAPCQHGGTCTDLLNDHTCTCVAGYTGTNCEVDIDECAAGPCQNNGTCTDLVNAFACSCDDGFTGATCATDIDDCASSPCQNGATCTDLVANYTCVCPATFTGANCETEVLVDNGGGGFAGQAAQETAGLNLGGDTGGGSNIAVYAGLGIGGLCLIVLIVFAVRKRKETKQTSVSKVTSIRLDSHDSLSDDDGRRRGSVGSDAQRIISDGDDNDSPKSGAGGSSRGSDERRPASRPTSRGATSQVSASQVSSRILPVRRPTSGPGAMVPDDEDEFGLDVDEEEVGAGRGASHGGAAGADRYARMSSHTPRDSPRTSDASAQGAGKADGDHELTRPPSMVAWNKEDGKGGDAGGLLAKRSLYGGGKT